MKTYGNYRQKIGKKSPPSPTPPGQEILCYEPDVLGLCEVDRFEELEEELQQLGYEGSYKRKRRSAVAEMVGLVI